MCCTRESEESGSPNGCLAGMEASFTSRCMISFRWMSVTSSVFAYFWLLFLKSNREKDSIIFLVNPEYGFFPNTSCHYVADYTMSFYTHKTSMKKYLSISFVIAFLVSCTPQESIPMIDPDEVLKRSAEASRNLESADYTASVKFSVGGANNTIQAQGNTKITGSLQNAGEQLHFMIDGSASGKDTGGDFSINGKLEIIVAGRDEVYLKVHSLTSSTEHSLFKSEIIEKISGQWFKLPVSGDSKDLAAVTPDPGLIQAQTEVVKIVEEKGIETINGRKTYHYKVAVDRDRLLAYLQRAADEKGEELQPEKVRDTIDDVIMEGELWIDVKTFYLQKLEWDITNGDEEEGMTISFTVNMENHDNTDPITPPEGAEPFSPLIFLQDDANTLPLLEELPPIQDDMLKNFQDLDQEEQQKMIQDLLGE